MSWAARVAFVIPLISLGYHMENLTLYSLRDAARELGADSKTLAYLLRDRRIPHGHVAKATVVDAKGLGRLRKALAEYKGRMVAQA